ncbi:MAG: hypothetical protein K2Q22_13135 [Cytophagales bacterium]|nr:hypothetical protein [Cytophagales bacterium]
MIKINNIDLDNSSIKNINAKDNLEIKDAKLKNSNLDNISDLTVEKDKKKDLPLWFKWIAGVISVGVGILAVVKTIISCTKVP